MSWTQAGRRAVCCVLLVGLTGCANRPGWGFAWGQGTAERQQSRAVIHDPFPLNDIGPEVVGGRPREFANPQPEPVRERMTEERFPTSFGFPR